MSKTIVITGGAGGLGGALARRFSSDGETVILLGRTAAKVEALAGELGAPAMALQCDVSSPDSVRRAFASIAERHPRIDVLINNAGIFHPALLAEASDEHILQTININLTGPILCARAAIPMLPAGGHIINVTSESVALPFPHLTLYQCSKAGLEQLTVSLDRELESSGIRVTTVRAGQMVGDTMSWDVDPAAIARFMGAAAAAGLNLMERPVSRFETVTGVFRSIIDLPPDVHVVHVSVHARAKGE
jgi:meso-butanediol dehydrogenase / (S,S)-butanediol dehydrogenase / diacetyl reductase